MSDPQAIAAVLLDIEGTITPIDFVTQVLFPYARAELSHYLATEWNSEDLHADLTHLEAEYAGEDAPATSLSGWDPQNRRQSAEFYLLWLMDRDRKSPALKSIQGKIWRRGYETGRLVGQVYSDVPAFLKRWKVSGGRAYIYSSGSVLAQKLLLEHSDHGDLTLLLDGYFDTSVGPKREPASYGTISATISVAPGAILFVSDVIAELTAARAAGLQTVLSIRPGNPQVDPEDYRAVTDFAALSL